MLFAVHVALQDKAALEEHRFEENLRPREPDLGGSSFFLRVLMLGPFQTRPKRNYPFLLSPRFEREPFDSF